MIQKIKWAYQRLTRGWDDRLFWGMSTYIDPMVLAMAKHLRESAMGHPTNVTAKKWNKALDVIIKGFRDEPELSAKEWKKYLKDREKALVLLAYYWDNLWD